MKDRTIITDVLIGLFLTGVGEWLVMIAAAEMLHLIAEVIF